MPTPHNRGRGSSQHIQPLNLLPILEKLRRTWWQESSKHGTKRKEVWTQSLPWIRPIMLPSKILMERKPSMGWWTSSQRWLPTYWWLGTRQQAQPEITRQVAITTLKPIIKGKSKVDWVTPNILEISPMGTAVSITLAHNQKLPKFAVAKANLPMLVLLLTATWTKGLITTETVHLQQQ